MYTWSVAQTYGYDIINVYIILDTLCTQVAKVCSSFRAENVPPKTLDDNLHIYHHDHNINRDLECCIEPGILEVTVRLCPW